MSRATKTHVLDFETDKGQEYANGVKSYCGRFYKTKETAKESGLITKRTVVSRAKKGKDLSSLCGNCRSALKV